MGFLSEYFRRPEGDTTGNKSGDPGGGPPPADPELGRFISSALADHAPADPDTGRQWTRLERAIAGEAGAPRPERALSRPAWWNLTARMQPGLMPRYIIGLAVIFAVAVLATLQLSKKEPRHYTTARGEQSVVTLPDESEVLLNHTSTLDFDIAGFLRDRRVTLTGEAFFKIRKTDFPFTVRTDAGTITVTGTKFNVRVRNGHYEVGVTEGAVRTILPVAGGSTSVTLAAGEAVSGKRDDYFPDIRKIQYAAYPGWPERMLIFTRMDLRTVCAEVTDYFNVGITLADSSLGALTVTGAFDARDAGNVVSSLCLLTGRQFRYEKGGYLLY